MIVAQIKIKFECISLNEKAKRFLEMEFATVKVEGEISDLIKHRSGHWYFSLKDEESQLRGVMFRSQNNKVILI